MKPKVKAKDDRWVMLLSILYDLTNNHMCSESTRQELDRLMLYVTEKDKLGGNHDRE